MTLTERVADFMAISQPGDAMALSKNADVETGTGVLLSRCQAGFTVQLCFDVPMDNDFNAAQIVAGAEALCVGIGATLDS